MQKNSSAQRWIQVETFSAWRAMLLEFLGADSCHVVKNLLEKRVLRIPFLPGTERNPPTQVRAGCNLSHAISKLWAVFAHFKTVNPKPYISHANSNIHVDGASQAAPTKSGWNGEKTSAQLWQEVVLLSEIGTHRVGTPNPTGPSRAKKNNIPVPCLSIDSWSSAHISTPMASSFEYILQICSCLQWCLSGVPYFRRAAIQGVAPSRLQ